MKLLLAPLLAAAIIALVAQPPIAEFSNLTSTTILGWYAWHTATKTLPQLVENFRAELATERSQNRADRETFLREMSEERTQRHADNMDVVGAIERLSESAGQARAATR
jgi:hypothetical protein